MTKVTSHMTHIMHHTSHITRHTPHLNVGHAVEGNERDVGNDDGKRDAEESIGGVIVTAGG